MATMTGVRKLARAILSYYPEAKTDLTDNFEAKLWAAVLRDISDDDLLIALAKHVREGNRYPPNAAEIHKAATKGKKPGLNAPEYLGQTKAVYDAYRTHVQRCWEAGIPTAVEAKRRGMSDRQWSEMADKAGV